ncbi:MAG: HAMP domain-containing sensor histidine kinase [Actinomycetes bacterium]
MPSAQPKSMIGKAWSRISLRTRLTVISVGVITMLLSVSLLGTVSLLKTYLQQNTDSLLIQTASLLAQEDPITISEKLATNEVTLPPLPSDYYIAFLDPQGKIYLGLVLAPSQNNQVPNLEQFNVVSVVATHGTPFTTQLISKKAPGHKSQPWRLVALPSPYQSGSVVVALPVGLNGAIVSQYQSIGLGFSGLLLAISGLALWLTISSALRPLREVSAAADSVRSGKLDRRLPDVAGKTEIAKLNRSLNEMLSSVEGSLKARNTTLDRMRQFIADASHELRTPLVTLRGYAELYRKGAFKSKAQVDDAMQRIESEAIRMSALVESLLALARLDGDIELQIIPCDLAEVAKSVAVNISTGNPTAEITISDAKGKAIIGELFASFDEPAMRQVFTNLLFNAINFAGEKPIEVVLDQQSDKTIIEVRDHGEGIPKELRKKIFERFYRSDNSRNRDTGGSGLGLAIVQGVIDGHNGSIVALETPGGGATFRISIPN